MHFTQYFPYTFCISLPALFFPGHSTQRALAFSSLLCLLLALRENKANWKSTIKRSWLFPALSGGGGALSILFMLLLVKLNMSPVILYPGVAVGGLLITILFSVFLFREKLRPQQWLGLFIGAISLVLLNL